VRTLILLPFLLTLSLAQFDWQDDGAPIRQGLHIEWQRTGDANADGSMIYAWSDCRNGVRDIIVQKVDVNGNNLWGDHGIVAVNSYGRQEDPQLVTDGNGGAFVIWMDYRDESDSEGDVYAQHVLSDGSISWGNDGLALANQEGQQASPNICSDGVGGAYVIWRDGSSSSYGEVYGTHLSSQGAIAAGTGVPLVTYPSYRSNPSLNTGGGGDAVLIWNDDRNSDLDLYAQRISVSGNSLLTQWSSDGKLVCNAENDQTSPRVAQFGGTQTIMTWEDSRNGFKEVYYQILDENGNAVLNPNGNVACSGEWEIIKPRVKAENSTAYIVWEDKRNGWFSDIFVQKINASGNTEWENGLAVITEDATQAEPRLTTDGNSGVYIVWEDQRNSGTNGVDIYVQHIDASGNMTYDNDGLLICDAPDLQFNPLVRNDGNGGAMVVWGDQRTGGSYGMYVQHLNSSGVTLTEDGRDSFFGIATDAANEPYKHDILYLGSDQSLVYWQDNRWGYPTIYGSILSSAYDGTSDYFSNSSINGRKLSTLEISQKSPKAIVVGNSIFLGFIVEESPNENIYLQILDYNLNQSGDAVALSSPETSKQGFDMTLGNDGAVYVAYSESFDVSLQKLTSGGNSVWTVDVAINSADDIINAIYPLPGSGVVIIYESQHWQTGSNIFAVAVDENGSVMSGWPLNISSASGDQFYEGSFSTDSGVFVTFTDNTSGSSDIYGQYLTYSGDLSSGGTGVPIADSSDDEQSSDIVYEASLNQALICYEISNDSDVNLHCKNIQVPTQNVGNTIILTEDIYDQKKPELSVSGNNFLIAWEDSRNSGGDPGLVDIYFQKISSGSSTYSDGGIPICTYEQKQERPRISKYSDSDNSFIIIWEDYRSTGKEYCANLYGQSFTNCSSMGDLNGDGGWNVLDIVTLANCILNNNCSALEYGCAGDLNGDGFFNVLDIVTLANCILGQNCGGRIDDASEVKLNFQDNTLMAVSDGFLGGVQMTLSHGKDFTLTGFGNSLYSDFIKEGNETRLIIVNPTEEKLFSFSGNFEIEEVIAANSNHEISVQLPQVFKLGDPYPNPFNPVTQLEITLPVNGDLKVAVYNTLGQQVSLLADGYFAKNTYSFTWEAGDFSSGVYIVRAEANGMNISKKLMLIK